MGETSHPIEAQILLVAGTHASVPLDRLPDLVTRAQTHIRAHRDEYERRYELISGPRAADYVCVEPGHWQEIGAAVGLNERETDAVRRAHVSQFERDGRRLDREGEFEATLEIRDVLAVSASP